MACDIHDREGESPSPMEPRLGRMLRSSATGRRRHEVFLRPSGFVKRRDRALFGRPVTGIEIASWKPDLQRRASGWGAGEREGPVTRFDSVKQSNEAGSV